jgi:hypothetical protein
MAPSPSAFKAIEDAKAMQIDITNPAKTVQIGAGLNHKEESELVNFLRCNKDIFAWSSAEMPGVSREVAEQTLTLSWFKADQAGLWCFNQEKHRAMGEKLSRLLAASFIMKIQHPDCIDNLVPVLKKGEKW